MLFSRALLAFLMLLGTVAFLVPSLLVPQLSTRRFHLIGLAPWDPPLRLVRVGLYRYSRNPMYVGVLLIVVGWATGFRMPSLAIYAVVVAILFHLRVLLHEEP
jgi:protein-S-isoprenylcysteine O-methyltransferase Ste14